MPGRLFYARARVETQRELRAAGHGVLEAIQLSRMLDDKVIDDMTKQVKATTAVKKLGDGAILQKIVEFFNSDLGKALVKLLLSLLLTKDPTPVEADVTNPAPTEPTTEDDPANG